MADEHYIVMDESLDVSSNVCSQPRRPKVSWAAAEEAWAADYYPPVRPRLEYCIQLRGLQREKGISLLEEVQRRAMEMSRRVGHLPDEDRLRYLR